MPLPAPCATAVACRSLATAAGDQTLVGPAIHPAPAQQSIGSASHLAHVAGGLQRERALAGVHGVGAEDLCNLHHLGACGAGGRVHLRGSVVGRGCWARMATEPCSVQCSVGEPQVVRERPLLPQQLTATSSRQHARPSTPSIPLLPHTHLDQDELALHVALVRDVLNVPHIHQLGDLWAGAGAQQRRLKDG